MLRKFILVAFMALVAPGSTVQLMSAQLVCFAFVLLLVHSSPYKKDEADFTNMASTAARDRHVTLANIFRHSLMAGRFVRVLPWSGRQRPDHALFAGRHGAQDRHAPP